jgi:hypothetical protein
LGAIKGAAKALSPAMSITSSEVLIVIEKFDFDGVMVEVERWCLVSAFWAKSVFIEIQRKLHVCLSGMMNVIQSNPGSQEHFSRLLDKPAP